VDRAHHRRFLGRTLENTVAVIPGGLWVLTEPDGGQAELEARGVPFAPLC